MKYKIPVEWAVYDTVEIEADTLEEAIKKFDETIDYIPLGTEPEYIDGSYQREIQGNETETLEYYKLLNK